MRLLILYFAVLAIWTVALGLHDGLALDNVLGVLRWQLALDAAIRPLLQRPNADLHPAALLALRLGAFRRVFWLYAISLTCPFLKAPKLIIKS